MQVIMGIYTISWDRDVHNEPLRSGSFIQILVSDLVGSLLLKLLNVAERVTRRSNGKTESQDVKPKLICFRCTSSRLFRYSTLRLAPPRSFCHGGDDDVTGSTGTISEIYNDTGLKRILRWV